MSQVFSYYEKMGLYIDCSLIHVDSWPIVGTSSDEGMFWIKTSKDPFGSFGELWVKNQTPWKLGKYGHQMKKSAQSLFSTRVPKFFDP